MALINVDLLVLNPKIGHPLYTISSQQNHLQKLTLVFLLLFSVGRLIMLTQ
eukprot:m.339135 g.339135  ORF g.339135 m.339135 type:complete len:51 (-) comp18680_c0_seq1:1855-2007(-)